MKDKFPKQFRVLGLAPSSRGLGFAVMTDRNTLVNWGVKPVKSGKKNERSLSDAANLITRFNPHLIVVEEMAGSHRGPRVQGLVQDIVALAANEKIAVRQFLRKQVNLEILNDESGTKHQLAESIASRFPEELGFRLPQKRRLWTSEAYQTDIFQAVALAHCSFSACRRGPLQRAYHNSRA